MKLEKILVNNHIKALCQTNASQALMRRYYRKINIEKLLGYQAIAIHFNLPQVCPSALPFLFAVVPTLSILINFVTLLL